MNTEAYLAVLNAISTAVDLLKKTKGKKEEDRDKLKKSVNILLLAGATLMADKKNKERSEDDLNREDNSNEDSGV